MEIIKYKDFLKEGALPSQKSLDQLKKVSKTASKTDVSKKTKKGEGEKNLDMKKIQSQENFDKKKK